MQFFYTNTIPKGTSFSRRRFLRSYRVGALPQARRASAKELGCYPTGTLRRGVKPPQIKKLKNILIGFKFFNIY